MRNRYEEALAQRRVNGSLRSLPTINSDIDFYSNDYLSLAINKDLFAEIE